MERRCAVYARYSSDLQRGSSIEDQVRKCREFADAKAWPIVDEYVLFDEAVSGSALSGRVGLESLISTAKRSPRPFDCILIDDTSRLARNLPDALRTAETLIYHGVSVVFVAQGIDTVDPSARMLLTVHGMVDEQYLVGHRQKVHRGQEGRVLKGQTPGGRCYGYRNVPIEDPTRQGKYGRPAVLGVEQVIHEKEAVVIRRIFQMYAEGLGLAGMAKRLNAEGVLSPTPAKNRKMQVWSRYSIREMLHNEKYRGIVVWNRTRKERDPDTGRKVSRARPPAEWKRIEAPELRIVPEELWNTAHKRNAEVNRLGISRLGGMCRTASSRTYLFSGLLGCGHCGSNMVIISGGGKRGYVKYGCHAHKHTGVCENNWTIRRERLEDQLLSAIEARVFKAETLEYLIQRCQQELARKLKEMERQGTMLTTDGLKRQREELRVQAARLAEAIGKGGELDSLLRRLGVVESEIRNLDHAIATHRPLNMKVTPEKVREHVIKSMMQLRATISDSEVATARAALHKHIGRLVLTPTIKDGRKVFWVSGNVTPMPEAGDGRMQLVARDGIEPPTPAFSGLRPSTAKSLQILAQLRYSRWKTGD